MALVQANERSVNRQRQKSAFPPNYVHSLDSSHMMKTALGCNEAGLTFASVHDSFWTHARDVDKMGSILRDAFVDLHDQDLLGQLLDQFQRQHPRITFPPIPTRGDFDVKDVTKSSYFFN
jgi:DNA-directed RNA polymerase, mitochondrial